VEPILRAEEELKSYTTAQVAIDPDRYYQLMLQILGNEKAARKAQAELMLIQMQR
jgi:hypothetical protein